MKQKMALFIATMVLASSITACGQNGDGVSNETSTVVEETTEQIASEKIEEKATDVEETEVNEYGFDVYANAEEKFQRLNEAYWDILDGTDHPGALFLEITQNNVEKLTIDGYDFTNDELNMTLSNGQSLNPNQVCYSVLMGYYGNRINNGESWYDIKEWVAQFDTEEELMADFFEAEEDGNIYWIDCYMGTVASYAATIANADEVTFGEPIEENFEYSGDHESAYLMPIFLDGNDYSIYAIFDAEGNLINIDDTNLDMPDGVFIYTWGEGADYKQQTSQADYVTWGIDGNAAKLNTIYDFETCCADETSKTTNIKVTFSNYRTFASDDTHVAKEGYEWKTVDINLAVGDENAYDYGWNYGEFWDDFYHFLPENMGLNWEEKFTISYNGEIYSECEFYSDEVSRWDENGDVDKKNQFGWQHIATGSFTVSVLVPEGYDGFVYGLYNLQSDFEDVARAEANPDDYIYFRFE